MIDKAAARNILATVIEAIKEDYLIVDSELTKAGILLYYKPLYTQEQYDNYKLYKSIFVED